MNDTPSLPERDLPPGRHRQLKEHLMREIRRDDTADKAPSRPRWLRPAVAAPAAAGVLTLALVAGVTVLGGSHGDGTPTAKDRGNASQVTPHTPDDPSDPVPLLDRIATVAAESTVPAHIRDDQFVYVRSMDTSVAQTMDVDKDGKAKPTRSKVIPLHKREVWHSVDGTRGILIRDRVALGRDIDVTEPDPAPGETGYEYSNNYRHLETLPTDPDEMLQWLLSNGVKGEDRDANQEAFNLVRDLMGEALVPPDVSAAMYRAAGRIPGVIVVPDVKDAAGRPAVAIARVDSYNGGWCDQALFDEKTLEFLGNRSVWIKPGKGTAGKKMTTLERIRAGKVTSSSAVLEVTVVDKKGQLPKG